MSQQSHLTGRDTLLAPKSGFSQGSCSHLLNILVEENMEYTAGTRCQQENQSIILDSTYSTFSFGHLTCRVI